MCYKRIITLYDKVKYCLREFKSYLEYGDLSSNYIKNFTNYLTIVLRSFYSNDFINYVSLMFRIEYFR